MAPGVERQPSSVSSAARGLDRGGSPEEAAEEEEEKIERGERGENQGDWEKKHHRRQGLAIQVKEMVRAPCCERMGLKKGPWTAEEDQVLVAYIQSYGHGNWRALPRLAGLLRCGKSCRLRWMNYLRPDIKRGNFSKEEEDTIIDLHELLGNRWSAIAARLPGRTDNEIKNVWHTHLKKRAKPGPASQQTKKKARRENSAADTKPITLQLDPAAAATPAAYTRYEDASPVPPSPTQSCSEFSSSTCSIDCSTTTRATSGTASLNDEAYTDLSEKFLDMDESFWSKALSALDNSVAPSVFATPCGSLPLDHVGGGLDQFHTDASSGEDDEDFWLRVFMQAGGMPELPGF